MLESSLTPWQSLLTIARAHPEIDPNVLISFSIKPIVQQLFDIKPLAPEQTVLGTSQGPALIKTLKLYLEDPLYKAGQEAHWPVTQEWLNELKGYTRDGD